MIFNPHPAPHIRTSQTTWGVMGDAVAALGFLYAMAYYYHGLRALVLGLTSVGVCVLADIICCLTARRRLNPRDLSAVVTGMVLPLMMPATVSYVIVGVAGLFAILIAKHPFGGVGNNVFNPAAAGFSFAAICFGNAMFTYPPPDFVPPVFGAEQFAQASSPAYTLMLGGIPQYDVLDMLLGKYPGPMGATNILVLVACLLYLVFRGTVRWSMPVSFFAAVALLSWAFPRSTASGLGSVGYEMATGLLLFCGIFLLGDPVTTPKREMAKVAFGLTAGVMAMVFRHTGKIEEEITFAILAMNAVVWGFDMIGERVASLIRRKRLGTGKNTQIQKTA